jgi:hypothetical protein
MADTRAPAAAADARRSGLVLPCGRATAGVVLARLGEGWLPLRGPLGLGMRVQESARWAFGEGGGRAGLLGRG